MSDENTSNDQPPENEQAPRKRKRGKQAPETILTVGDFLRARRAARK